MQKEKTSYLHYGYLSSVNNIQCNCFCHGHTKNVDQSQICTCHKIPFPIGASYDMNTILIQSALYEHEYHLKQFLLLPNDPNDVEQLPKLAEDVDNIVKKIRRHEYSKLYFELIQMKKKNELMDKNFMFKWEQQRRNFIVDFNPPDPVCAQVITIQFFN